MPNGGGGNFPPDGDGSPLAGAGTHSIRSQIASVITRGTDTSGHLTERHALESAYCAQGGGVPRGASTVTLTGSVAAPAWPRTISR